MRITSFFLLSMLFILGITAAARAQNNTQILGSQTVTTIGDCQVYSSDGISSNTSVAGFVVIACKNTNRDLLRGSTSPQSYSSGHGCPSGSTFQSTGGVCEVLPNGNHIWNAGFWNDSVSSNLPGRSILSELVPGNPAGSTPYLRSVDVNGVQRVLVSTYYPAKCSASETGATLDYSVGIDMGTGLPFGPAFGRLPTGAFNQAGMSVLGNFPWPATPTSFSVWGGACVNTDILKSGKRF